MYYLRSNTHEFRFSIEKNDKNRLESIAKVDLEKQQGAEDVNQSAADDLIGLATTGKTSSSKDSGQDKSGMKALENLKKILSRLEGELSPAEEEEKENAANNTLLKEAPGENQQKAAKPPASRCRVMQKQVLQKILEPAFEELVPVLEFVGFELNETGTAFVLKDSAELKILSAVIQKLKDCEVLGRDPESFSFADVMHFVQTGAKLPGIAVVNDQPEEAKTPTESTMSRPRKPWMKN